jgi:predicted NBD/HSP70 family sugar kinase
MHAVEQPHRRRNSADHTHSTIFTTIVTKGPLSRRDIAALTGLSQSTVTKAVKPLLAAGFVVEEKEQAQGPGRPVIPLRVNPQRHHVVGIKASARELTGVLIDPQADVLASARRSLASSDPEGVAGEIAALAHELIEREARFAASAEGLGVAFGGHVDGRSGSIRYAPMLGWRNVPMGHMLEARTELFTVVENDVNALAVAEQWFGAGRDIPSFAVVTVGAGVGCGLVVDGELLHGANGLAGELGHVVVRPDGERCPCGSQGCLETVASEGAIVRAARRTGSAVETIDEAAVLARSGDEGCRRAFAEAGEALGQGISIVLNLVNPSRVILSGEGVVASDLLLDNLRESLRRHTFSDAADCDLLTRPLGDESWARGAAANALRHLIDRPQQRRLATTGLESRR